MRKKLFTLLLAVAASIGTMSAAITVRLDPSSCSSWSTVRLWAWTDEGNLFDSWPGQIVSQDGDGWYSYTFDEDITSVSIIWNNGTYQTVDIEGVTSSTCYALNSTSGTAIKVSVVDCSSGSSQGGTPVSGKYKIGDLYYNLDATNQTAEVTFQLEWDKDNYKGLTDANIPASVEFNSVTYSVTSIGERAFYNCSSLTSVTIGNSVTSIGYYAFYNCSSLTSITIPNSVTSIGEGAFLDCSSLPFVTIPNSVTSIGEYAFSGCVSFIIVDNGNTVYDSRNDCNAIIETATNTLITGCKNTTIPNSVTSIGNYAFYNCSGLTSVTIPNSVTSIGEYAFYNCSSLTSVAIGNSVTSIGDGAFYGCSGLISVTIGNSVTSIGDEAFSGCSSLTSVVWNAKNCADFNYNNSPFFNNDNDYSSFDLRNQITSFTFGNEVEHIPAFLCNGMSNLTSISIVIPNSVTSIGRSAFSGCTGLTSVTIPNSVTSIGDEVFYGCGINKIYFSGTMEEWLSKSWSPGHISSSYSLYINDVAVTNVVIPNSVTSIGEYAFSYCSSLTSVTIPNSVTSIGGGAFGGCTGLTSVTIPNSVTSIGDEAFDGCNNLKNVIIGSSVKVLEEYAFCDCSAIETITCYGQRPPTVNQGALYGLDYSTIVYVPADYLETYKMHDAWGLYDVRPLGAKSTETTNLNVTPAETTAEVAWPAVSGAATYELVIKDKSGNVICTLIFNSNGQLTQIAFNAPSRNNAPQQTQAAGFSFTVTGLEEGTSYDLTITSKDNNGTTLDTKTVSFTTQKGSGNGGNDDQGGGDSGDNTGDNGDDNPSDNPGDQAIDNTPFPSGEGRGEPSKILRDGKMYIIRGEKVYTIDGRKVR